jgi:hypothetical protein
MLYTLVLLVGVNMTAIPGFNSFAACESAGRQFVAAAAREKQPRFYCFKG